MGKLMLLIWLSDVVSLCAGVNGAARSRRGVN